MYKSVGIAHLQMSSTAHPSTVNTSSQRMNTRTSRHRLLNSTPPVQGSISGIAAVSLLAQARRSHHQTITLGYVGAFVLSQRSDAFDIKGDDLALQEGTCDIT
jgi:hypothetical protein